MEDNVITIEEVNKAIEAWRALESAQARFSQLWSNSSREQRQKVLAAITEGYQDLTEELQTCGSDMFNELSSWT